MTTASSSPCSTSRSKEPYNTRERALKHPSKSPITPGKEPHVELRQKANARGCCAQVWKKRPVSPVKQTYMTHKRALYIIPKRPTRAVAALRYAKEPCITRKRALCFLQKRPANTFAALRYAKSALHSS